MRLVIAGMFVLVFFASCSTDSARTEPLEADLAQYPRFFVENGSFDSVIVVDALAAIEDRASARLLADSLGTDRVVEYPMFNAIFDEDSILVGSCSQEPANRFVNLWADCLSMRDDQAIIRITRTESSWVLVVVGDTEADTRRAIDALIEEDPRISGEDVEVRYEDDDIVIGEPT